MNPEPVQLGDPDLEQTVRLRAGRLSLAASAAIFTAKVAVWGMTGSSAVFSDAMESVVNVVAAALLLYSLLVAARPPDPDHPYGHGKVEFFSAGVEGALILLAALAILFEAARELVRGPEVRNLDMGLVLLAVVSAANGWLGFHLVSVGRRTGSTALVADGQHVLTDVWTSVGVIGGLALVRLTNIVVLDPLVAMAVAANVLRTGWLLAREAVGGLMDEAPETLLATVAAALDARREPAWIDVHSLRAWRSGGFTHVDLHLVVPRYLDVDQLHRYDERIDGIVHNALGGSTEVITHFDPCRPRLCTSCEMADCEIREAPFRERFPWSRARATRVDESLETGAPLAPRDASGAVACDAFVGLGSNLGDRAAHLRAAAAALAATPGVEVLAHSHVYETDPVGPPPQGPYLNAAMHLRTTLAPDALLERLLEIERSEGRERDGTRDAPRTLDLDLLDYDGRALPEPGAPPKDGAALELPHPRLHERAFVLAPLSEIAGERVHPRLGVRYDELARRVRDPEAVRPWSGTGGDDPWQSWP